MVGKCLESTKQLLPSQGYPNFTLDLHFACVHGTSYSGRKAVFMTHFGNLEVIIFKVMGFPKPVLTARTTQKKNLQLKTCRNNLPLSQKRWHSS